MRQLASPPRPRGTTGDDPVLALPDRRWRRRLRSARRYLLSVAATVVVAVVVWAVMFSSLLGVSHVRVVGAKRLSSAAIVGAAHIGPGTPLARLSLGAIAARVETLPAVADASVARSWPHTVVITVTERVPLATLHHAGDWWLMDASGALFAASASLDHSYPIAAIPASAQPRSRAEVGAVLAALPNRLRDAVRRVTAHSVDSITLTLTDGTLVRWGNAAQTGFKARVLDVLIGASKGRPKVYDVSVPQEPTTSMH